MRHTGRVCYKCGARMQEFCNGGSMRQALSRGLFGGRLRRRWQPIILSLKSIASGMDYMHAKRICHGDLNPNNILIKVRPQRTRCVRCAVLC